MEPEIRLAMTDAGRETLDAIAEELAPTQRSSAKGPRATVDSGPEIRVSEGPAGRDTLAAIGSEALSMPEPRNPLATLPYGDRVPNAPGAVTPSRPPTARIPETTAKTADVARDGTLVDAEIFEMLTFLVRHPDPGELTTDAARRSFVEKRLAGRLPDGNIDVVSRIDVTPWTERDTVILRVWCRVR